MTIEIDISIDRLEDSEMFFFLERFSDSPLNGDHARVVMRNKYQLDGEINLECEVNSQRLKYQAANEVLKKFRSSQNLIVHNSTANNRNIFFVGESYTEVLETNFSSDDRKKISEAQTRLQNSVKRAAKQHKEDLDKLLGRLSDKYQVELSSVSGVRSAKFPLEVKLTDKRVDISLKDWGAGTQNRTRILMSVLETIRLRDSANSENRTTPVFIVEEPESFLHPSAQAEFGQVLNALADELKIQIVATTHSPYMLNQSQPAANFLLERKSVRGSPKNTVLRDTSGDEWMAPFAENLGIVPNEFTNWKKLFGTHTSSVVLVEGDIDKEYFDHIKGNYSSIYSIPGDVEIVPYGGKDALKNTSILQFMINKFGRVYITFDLDAEAEVKRALERIGLLPIVDFCAIGKDAPGSECIEGLLPTQIKQKVYSEKYDLVTALSSQDTSARKSAKNRLKAEFLEVFKSQTLSTRDLVDFKKLFDQISAAFIK